MLWNKILWSLSLKTQFVFVLSTRHQNYLGKSLHSILILVLTQGVTKLSNLLKLPFFLHQYPVVSFQTKACNQLFNYCYLWACNCWLGLEQGEFESCNVKSCRAKIHGLKWVRNIFYARIQASKEDCLCRGLRIAKGLSGQGNKYNISHLTISLEAIFSEMIRTKKDFIFRQGKCIYRNSMKTRP